jgi:hypothetical protein
VSGEVPARKGAVQLALALTVEAGVTPVQVVLLQAVTPCGAQMLQCHVIKQGKQHGDMVNASMHRALELQSRSRIRRNAIELFLVYAMYSHHKACSRATRWFLK